MKRSILIITIAFLTCWLTAFGYMNWSEGEPKLQEQAGRGSGSLDFQLISIMNTLDVPNIVYNIDSRFVNTISKEKLHNASSIIDILPEKATQPIEFCQSVRVSVLQGNEESDISETGYGETLTPAQVKLLQGIDYSTNIYVRADYKRTNTYTGELQDDYLTYFISVIPEQEAQYTEGQDALIDYLKENSRQERTFIDQNKLKPGQVYFTITEQGKVSDIELNSTSGYPPLDQKMLELIQKMPASWKPASNANGEVVSQKLVLFFGIQGC